MAQINKETTPLVAEPNAPAIIPERRSIFARLSGVGITRGSWFKAALIIILLILPLVYKNLYAQSVMTTAGIYTILTIGTGIVLVQAGQLSFAHSAFFGVGAYTCALLSNYTSVAPVLSLIVGALLAGVIALIVGRPVLRLRYFYLALATMGLGQIFTLVVSQLYNITGGTNGLGSMAEFKILGLDLTSFTRQYYVVWIIAIIILLLVERALKYRYGRALRAIATSEIASKSLGIRIPKWKLNAFVTSAVICGLGGGLFAFVTGSVNPSLFGFSAGVLPIIMVLVGGGVGIYGGVIGAIVMTWFTNAFSSIQQYSGVTYAIVLFLLLLFVPAGILGIRIPLPGRLRALQTRMWGKTQAAGTQALEAQTVEAEAGCAQEAPAALSDHVDPSDAVTCPPFGDVMMEVKGVSVIFGGLRALDDVSLELQEGTITALIGPNGAGKTTLFNAISRQQETQGGHIFFRGTDLTGLSTPEAARLGIARTFQNLRIFTNMSVVENVLVGCHRHERSGFWSTAFGLRRQRQEEKRSELRAMAVLRLVGLQEHAKTRASSLPYGRQRLVEIARALASDPELLLLDEPAAGMNNAEQVDLAQKIRAIRDSGVTILLVEHSMDLVMGLCDVVNVLDHGELIATGCPDDIKKNRRVIEAYLGSGAERQGATEAVCEAEPEIEDGKEELGRAGDAFLTVDNVETCYGSIKALHGVSLTVAKNEVVAVLGPNGAGKTTLLLTISGILQPTSGKVSFDGETISHMSPVKIVTRGLCQVPEGRQLFPTLSVEENLLMGVSGKKDWRNGFTDDIAYIYDLFPILGERRKQPARTLSGGEQQMLAIGRAMMGRPKLLLLDEPSMGLSPVAAERIFEALAKLNQGGLTLLMVEQNANRALGLAERVVVLRTGRVVLEERASKLKSDDRLHAAYLG